MEIRDGQQLCLTLSQPLARGSALTLWAVAVAAGVVGDNCMRALLATQGMAAENRCATALDRRHHLELVEAHMAGIDLTPCRTMVTEDIRDPQRRTRHARSVSAGRRSALEIFDEMIERAYDLTDCIGGNPRVESRGVEL